MGDITVRESESLTEGYDRRYVVTDPATGTVLDDARGCGYKTEVKAVRGYRFKNSARGRARMAKLKEERKRNKELRVKIRRAEKEKKKSWRTYRDASLKGDRNA